MEVIIALGSSYMVFGFGTSTITLKKEHNIFFARQFDNPHSHVHQIHRSCNEQG
jgi:hypothetical protein